MDESHGPPTLRAPGSHLYRGLVVRPDQAAVDQVPHGNVELSFGDGSRVDAEVMTDDRGRTTLWVAAYTTERGTVISERVWTATPTEDGALRVGTRLP